MSKTNILIHAVFTTKHRYQTIPLLHKRKLYEYIHGIIKAKNCRTIRINGMSDHIHILFDLHPTVAVADLIKNIKQSSTTWMKSSLYFSLFEGWNEGYYASSISPSDKDSCIEYIKSQEMHHGGQMLLDELKELALEYHLDWDNRDWS